MSVFRPALTMTAVVNEDSATLHVRNILNGSFTGWVDGDESFCSQLEQSDALHSSQHDELRYDDNCTN